MYKNGASYLLVIEWDTCEKPDPDDLEQPETDGDALTFHDFADEAEAEAFYTRLLITGAIAAMEAL